MDFEFSCFISYRGGKSKFLKKFIEDLRDALLTELELALDGDVYYDKERLQGGSIIDASLAKSLCQSLCMVVVFTSGYFSKNRTYCAREYMAMEQLEEARQNLLSDKSNGLIIPIILRGKEYFPAVIRTKRNYYDFTDLLPDDALGLAKPQDYLKVVRKIAEYIIARYHELDGIDDPSLRCTDFKLPDHKEAIAWLNTLQEGPPDNVK